MARHITVDLHDLIEERREEAAEVEANQDELIEEAEENFGSFEETPDAMVRTYNELDDRRAELEEVADSVEELLDEEDWGDATLRLREPTLGDVATVQDQTGMDVQGVDDAMGGRAGAAQVAMIEQIITEAPAEAPEPVDYPLPVVRLLEPKLDKLGGGSGGMGKSSMRERMGS